ncbi:MAG: hypothetical protein Q9160_000421, partial [Pyrenula sp. 1 TL-2023]
MSMPVAEDPTLNMVKSAFTPMDEVVHEDTTVSSYERSETLTLEKPSRPPPPSRRSMAGIVYGPPTGAPPGHYKLPPMMDPPISRITRLVGSSDFRKRSTNSVLEVLLEEPRLLLRGGRTRKSSVALNSLGSYSQGDIGAEFTKNVPVLRQNPKRIRIRSSKLLKVLEKLAEANNRSFITTDSPSIVFLYPFKLFIDFETLIREQLIELENLQKERTEKLGQYSGTGHIVSLTDQEKASASLHDQYQGLGHFTPKEPDEEDPETLEHLRLLVEVLDTDLRPMFDLRRQIQHNTLSTIAYSDLWHLFERGQDVVVAGSKLQLCRVLRCTGGREPLAKHSQLVELQASLIADGQSVQKADIKQSTFTIACYDGEKAIVDLPIYPLAFGRGRDKIQETLIERGDLYLQLSRDGEASHKHYSGLTMDEPYEE